MRGYLRLIVMKNLANRKLSGYDLIKDIEKQCKILDKLKINKKEMHFPVKNILNI